MIKSDKLYIGIDQSLACTSVCLYQNGEVKIHQIKPDCNGTKRIKYIYDEFKKILFYSPNIEGAAIEGYAFGAKGLYFNLGEIGGILRLALAEANINSIQVPPTSLKKYVTGSGKSPKNVMVKEIYKNYNFDLNNDNDADACGLAILAREFFEEEFHLVTAYRTDLHKTCAIIVGDHQNRMTAKEYLKDAPDDMILADYEKVRKKRKIKEP